jgi:diguanylate cyclase (GGDEF)-like protein/PAS domain S-box-containing protein
VLFPSRDAMKALRKIRYLAGGGLRVIFMGASDRLQGKPLTLELAASDPLARVGGGLSLARDPRPAEIGVEASPVLELGWVLYRIKRAEQFGERVEFKGHVAPSASLAREVNEFWSDAARNYDELLVLAQWGGALFETDLNNLFSRIPNILTTAALQDLALSSERPDERLAIERRIQRLAADQALLTSYIALLQATWRTVEQEWNVVGRATVDTACGIWRSRLAEGVALSTMLPSDHAIFQIGLMSLLEAGLARHQVVVTPTYFASLGHITDLPGVLSVGVAAVRPSASNGYASRGRAVAAFARVVADPQRAATLALLLDSPSSVVEIAAATGVTARTVRAHIKMLTTAGTIEADSGSPKRFRAVDTGVDALFNEMSARIRRGHGRSTRLHAEKVAHGADFRAIFDGAPIAIIQFDLRGHCLSCNPQTRRIFGYSEQEMSHLRGVHLLAENDDRDVFEPFDETNAPLRRSEVRLRRKDGTIFWSSVTVSVVRDEQNVVRFCYAMIEDLSDRRGAEDPVTGLPNRTIFTDQLQRMIANSRRAETSFAVLMLDLDGFKQVNDSLGHDSGDVVLREVAARMTAAVRGVDMVARLGGDEFGVIPIGTSTPDTAMQIARKIGTALALPLSVAGRSVKVGVSIGIAMGPVHGTSVTLLLQRADEAMYAAKRDGCGPMVWHNGLPATVGVRDQGVPL